MRQQGLKQWSQTRFSPWRKSRPWEVSDGCVYLIRELIAAIASSHVNCRNLKLEGYLSELWGMLAVGDFKDRDRLDTTIYEQVISFLSQIKSSLHCDSYG